MLLSALDPMAMMGFVRPVPVLPNPELAAAVRRAVAQHKPGKALPMPDEWFGHEFYFGQEQQERAHEVPEFFYIAGVPLMPVEPIQTGAQRWPMVQAALRKMRSLYTWLTGRGSSTSP